MQNLIYDIKRGPYGVFKTKFEVTENTILVSRFAKSKLWLVELPHDGSVAEVAKLTNNLAQLDDPLFIDFVKIKTMKAEDLFEDDISSVEV